MIGVSQQKKKKKKKLDNRLISNLIWFYPCTPFDWKDLCYLGSVLLISRLHIGHNFSPNYYETIWMILHNVYF